jgi:hypothetical protein
MSRLIRLALTKLIFPHRYWDNLLEKIRFLYSENIAPGHAVIR